MGVAGSPGCPLPKALTTHAVSRTEQPLSVFPGALAHPCHIWSSRLGLGVPVWAEQSRIRADRFALPQVSLLLAQLLFQVLLEANSIPALSRALQIDKAAS